MNNNRLAFVQAIRGPILLIALGVLFIVDHAGGLPFHQTWPVLIILFGLLKLLERAVIRQPAPVLGSPPERLP